MKLMEYYREIPLKDVLEFIEKGDIGSLYIQKPSTGELLLAEKIDFNLKDFKKCKWFKRERSGGE